MTDQSKFKIDGNNLPLTIKPDWFTYFLAGVLCVIFLLPAIATIIMHSPSTKGIVIGLVPGIVLFIVVHGLRITIKEEGVVYNRLFVCSKSIRFDEMKKVWVEFGGNGRKPTYGLLIASVHPGKKPLVINIKPFSRGGLKTLIDIISSRAPSAQLDEKCERMKKRIMPSLVGDEEKMRSKSKVVDALLKDR
jgi:hypothetical protein